jgi:hypothetical protein
VNNKPEVDSLIALAGAGYDFEQVTAMNLVDENGVNRQSQIVFVSEPATMLICGLGMLGLIGFGRRRIVRKDAV